VKNVDKAIVTFNKKKFRFSDWLAERVIKAIAFLSIAIVILIFIFVFREAFPIFKMDKKEAASSEFLIQESYGGSEVENESEKVIDNQVYNSNVIHPLFFQIHGCRYQIIRGLECGRYFLAPLRLHS
jgi:hypothetical protein